MPHLVSLSRFVINKSDRSAFGFYLVRMRSFARGKQLFLCVFRLGFAGIDLNNILQVFDRFFLHFLNYLFVYMFIYLLVNFVCLYFVVVVVVAFFFLRDLLKVSPREF